MQNCVQSGGVIKDPIALYTYCGC